MKHDGWTDEGPESLLGPCCICERDGATVIICLTARSIVPGHGWGCAQCGLTADGATAVLCALCAAPYAGKGYEVERHLKFACRGYPATEGRMRFQDLRGEFQHVRHRHPELGPCPPLKVLPTDTRFASHVEEGERGCFCSRCSQTIFEGCVAIRCWPERGTYTYRFHPVCFGFEPQLWENPYAEDD